MYVCYWNMIVLHQVLYQVSVFFLSLHLFPWDSECECYIVSDFIIKQVDNNQVLIIHPLRRREWGLYCLLLSILPFVYLSVRKKNFSFLSNCRYRSHIFCFILCTIWPRILRAFDYKLFFTALLYHHILERPVTTWPSM